MDKEKYQSYLRHKLNDPQTDAESYYRIASNKRPTSRKRLPRINAPFFLILSYKRLLRITAPFLKGKSVIKYKNEWVCIMWFTNNIRPFFG